MIIDTEPTENVEYPKNMAFHTEMNNFRSIDYDNDDYFADNAVEIENYKTRK